MSLTKDWRFEMKKILLILFLIFSLIAGGADLLFAASSQVEKHLQRGSLHVIEIIWTAHTDGSYTSYLIKQAINGTLYRVETDPGTTAPDDNYTVALTNEGGMDIMGGTMADCDTANTERWSPYNAGSAQYGAEPVIGRLTLSIADNTVNGATGTIKIFYYAD